MLRHIARAAAIALVGSGALVACGSDQQACAAQGAPLPQSQTTYRPPARQRPVQKPAQKRTTSKVQDKPRTTIKTTQKPTSWAGYNDRVKQRNWSQPYRKGYDVPQQPIIINQYGHDYRTYPGYVGYYPIGVWPRGYGEHYGCVADREADPDQTPASPAPTVTVTATPEPSTSETPR